MLPAITLDCDMTAGDVLQVLARYGLWIDDRHPAARQRIEPLATRLHLAYGDVAAQLRGKPARFGAAIRRQWGTSVLWYARPVTEVLQRCAAEPPDQLLISVLNLHEPDSTPPIELRGDGDTLLPPGVVMDKGTPVGVSLPRPRMDAATVFRGDDQLSIQPAGAQPTGPRAAGPQPAGAVPAAPQPPKIVEAWPRVEAPSSVTAGNVFEVVVGFGASQQEGLHGGQVRLPAPPGQEWIDVLVEVTATPAVQAPDGWSRTMKVALTDPTAAQVSFRLVGITPTNRERVSLTMLEVRYLVAGTVCGTAMRPLAVFPAGAQPGAGARPVGDDWLASPAASSPVALVPDPAPPDLTIEILKPDRNAASGQYVCRLSSPRALSTPLGPFDVQLGTEAKAFAKQLVDDVRVSSRSPLVDNTLEGIGLLIAERLPQEVFDALEEIGAAMKPETPAVLIVSVEPYVPWELAWMQRPLDPARPSFLGAQVLLGRWLRDDAPPPRPGAGAPAVMRPALHPTAQAKVRHMAAMAAWYLPPAGLSRLPNAEAEAKLLVQRCGAVPLPASADAMRQLLKGTVAQGFDVIGRVQAVHFAGHGDFDPSRPDGSALFLSDGTPLRSTIFRSASYGGEHQPLLFLNACMLGIGGEVLGDMAGFPGNSLRGGFGAVLGALWEVDDKVAHDIALAFWEAALPQAAAGRGQPIGAVLRDLRAHYHPAAPVATYLAYVYYGHPRLTLERAVP